MPEYVVFVGAMKEKFDHSPVSAGDMLKAAGAVPEAEYILEALTDKGGNVEKEYQSTDSVDLGPPHKEKYFRAVPKGGGRA